MYRPIASEADQVSLQRDLTALERWGETWDMKFNAQKCQIMTIAQGRRRLSHFYTLCGHILESVQEAKYLGIIISDELSWSPHVNSVFNRANSTLGFLRRNLRRCPAALKETSYLTLIRSVMEYAAPIWDPHLQKDINLLESVQRRAARFIKGDYYTTSSVSHMLQDLGLHELKDRRRDLRLALMFKVVHGHIAVDATSIGLTPADGRTRANHINFAPSGQTLPHSNFPSPRELSARGIVYQPDLWSWTRRQPSRRTLNGTFIPPPPLRLDTRTTTSTRYSTRNRLQDKTSSLCSCVLCVTRWVTGISL